MIMKTKLIRCIICLVLCAGIILGIPGEHVFAGEVKTAKAIARVKDKLYDEKSVEYLGCTFILDSSKPGVLVREDAKGTRKELNKNISEFHVAEDCIIYRTTKSPSLFRMELDGTGRQRLDTYVREVYMVRDGYVYYNRFNNLFRIKLDGTDRLRLVRSNYSKQFAIVGDRVYYVVQKLVDDMTGTDYSYVRSKALDGSDVRKEIKKRNSWGELLTVGELVMVEYPSEAVEGVCPRFILGADGKWTKTDVDVIIRKAQDTCASADDGKIYYLTSAETDGDEIDEGASNSIYAMSPDGKFERIIDLDKSGVKLTYEYNSLELSGRYFVIITAYDQSMGNLYVLDKDGKKLRRVDLSKVDEDGTFRYRIVDDKLYLCIENYDDIRYYSYKII